MEIPSSQATKLSAREDFVKVDNTADKTRYSTLKLQELNAELKSLQDDYERVQRALSEDLCQQVKTMKRFVATSSSEPATRKSHEALRATSSSEPAARNYNEALRGNFVFRTRRTKLQ